MNVVYTHSGLYRDRPLQRLRGHRGRRVLPGQGGSTKYTRMHTHTHTRTHSQTLSHSHNYTHTHSHTHTHTRAHPHIQIRVESVEFSPDDPEKGYHGQTPVPVLTLAHLLQAIPPHIRIPRLRTDMQGFDFTGLASAGTLLKRVDSIEMECTGAAEEEIYHGVDNRFKDWRPYMTKLGFQSGHHWGTHFKVVDDQYHDCYWMRRDPDGTYATYPTELEDFIKHLPQGHQGTAVSLECKRAAV